METGPNGQGRLVRRCSSSLRRWRDRSADRVGRRVGWRQEGRSRGRVDGGGQFLGMENLLEKWVGGRREHQSLEIVAQTVAIFIQKVGDVVCDRASIVHNPERALGKLGFDKGPMRRLARVVGVEFVEHGLVAGTWESTLFVENEEDPDGFLHGCLN